MHHYIVSKSVLEGEITIPPSKSQTLRAILFATLATGKSAIYNYLHSPDTFAMVEACKLFGAKIDLFQDYMEIEGLSGKIRGAQDIIDSGNSGIVLRFCSAISALGSSPVVITGDDSIKTQRPMQDLLDGLSDVGVFAKSIKGNGFAPLVIQGPINPGKIVISGEDSQPVSALLIASAFCSSDMEIIVKNPGEKPWVALTLDWFTRLGIPYENDNFERFRLFGNAKYLGFSYYVPGDLSTLAFPVVAALITKSDLIIKNVDMNDLQGDKELIYVLQKMGALIEIDDKKKTLHVKKESVLKGTEIDINDFVDAFTILAVVGCFSEGTTTIYNGAVARKKECNRISSIARELRKMGASILEKEDGLVIETSSLVAADVHSYHDHRMAMSLSVAAMGVIGETKIGPVACVAKTFPSFLREFTSLGANIKEIL